MFLVTAHTGCVALLALAIGLAKRVRIAHGRVLSSSRSLLVRRRKPRHRRRTRCLLRLAEVSDRRRTAQRACFTVPYLPLSSGLRRWLAEHLGGTLTARRNGAYREYRKKGLPRSSTCSTPIRQASLRPGHGLLRLHHRPARPTPVARPSPRPALTAAAGPGQLGCRNWRCWPSVCANRPMTREDPQPLRTVANRSAIAPCPLLFCPADPGSALPSDLAMAHPHKDLTSRVWLRHRGRSDAADEGEPFVRCCSGLEPLQPTRPFLRPPPLPIRLSPATGA